ncbi:MAG TPA: thermonuclease family protein [Candidatus Omnitrophota bacterium]|nr:thermonuclease family protein [Candidatus Omnitrophota bacterium]
MTKQPTTTDQYRHVRKAVAAEFAAGAERLRHSYREEVVRTVWNIGKILRGPLGLLDKPDTRNAALVARLSRDFERPDSFFYDAAKFHRVYPQKPPLALSWSHYAQLIRLQDPRKRLLLEQKALSQSINTKDFRALTRLGPRQVPAPLLGQKAVLAVTRGRLYYYRVTRALAKNWALLNLGFGIEREVRCGRIACLHSGMIMRSVRKDETYTGKISPFDKDRLYTYAATLVRVIDGDTLVARVDLGFRTWITETFRLRGIDAPEVTSALGHKAKVNVRERLRLSVCLVIKTYKQEKYGRYLADVFYLRGCSDREKVLREGAFLNQALLKEGLAVPYEGEGAPVCETGS